MNFAGGHVFSYSSRPSTAAARMKDQVPHAERKQRNAMMRYILEKSACAYKERFLRQQLSVLWEKVDEVASDHWELQGLADNYLRVSSRAATNLWNQIAPVFIMGTTHRGLYGCISSPEDCSSF
jgi:threonylcarbamoyladenosine tRNA methylthiotransferase MtaB